MKDLMIRNGVAQDAFFITADPDQTSKPRGDASGTRRIRDGSWAKRRNWSECGFKLHVKPDLDHGLIRDLETTSASVHNSGVSQSRHVRMFYRDRGASA